MRYEERKESGITPRLGRAPEFLSITEAAEALSGVRQSNERDSGDGGYEMHSVVNALENTTEDRSQASE